MLRLNLHKFGGNGSGSGAKHHGSAGGRKMDNHAKEQEKKKNETGSLQVRSISERDKHTVFIMRHQNGREKEIIGGVLLENIKNNKIRYNKDLNRWVIKATNGQVIIRRKK